MKLIDYIQSIDESAINTEVGSILSDFWEVSKDVNPAKADRAAQEVFENILMDGINDFVQYVSKYKKKDSPDSPEAIKYSKLFISSLVKKLNSYKDSL